MAYQQITSLSELRDGDMRACVVDGHKVLLVRQGATVFAYEDRCAHLGVPMSAGRLKDGVLRCSAHLYEYDACTGQGVNPHNVCLKKYPVKLDAGAIWVDVEPNLQGDRVMQIDLVGPVLEAGEESRAVLSAIIALNSKVSVQDRGSYWRVLAPQRCEVTREAIEKISGKHFHLPQDLERVMPAFSGLLKIDDERAVWAFHQDKGS